MRVLTFLHSFEPGGVERDALRLNADWAAHGVEVAVVLGRTEGALAAEAPDLPYTVLQRGHTSTAAFETLFMIARLPGVVRRLRPDVIVCAGNTYSIVAVALRLLLGRHCPPIVLKVSNDLERRDLAAVARAAYHWWLRVQAPAFAAIVAMAPPARAEIVARMRVDPARVAVINNASITAAEVARLAATPRPAPRAGRRFLSVGRLVGQKNHLLLVDAFARIAGPDDRLTIIGEGPRRAAITARAQDRKVADRVALPGHRHPLDDAYADADAFVLSSDYEGLGVVVVEALAAGVPVVATDCCVNMPMLVDGVGARVPIRNAAALADAMTHAAASRPDRAAMRARAGAFTVEATGRQWLPLFAKAIADARDAAKASRPATIGS